LKLVLVFLPSLGREAIARNNADREARLAKSSLVHVGDPAPNFSLTTADGTEFSLSGANGKVVLIIFFATWCGPCQQELPHIEQIWNDNRGRGNFQLLVVGREESQETVREFRTKNGFTFPIAADPDRAVYSLFARESVPRTIVVSPEGLVVYSQAGFYEHDLVQLKAVIDEQLDGVAAVAERHKGQIVVRVESQSEER
jgi:peroxiredoxin